MFHEPIIPFYVISMVMSKEPIITSWVLCCITAFVFLYFCDRKIKHTDRTDFWGIFISNIMCFDRYQLLFVTVAWVILFNISFVRLDLIIDSDIWLFFATGFAINTLAEQVIKYRQKYHPKITPTS